MVKKEKVQQKPLLESGEYDTRLKVKKVNSKRKVENDEQEDECRVPNKLNTMIMTLAKEQLEMIDDDSETEVDVCRDEIAIDNEGFVVIDGDDGVDDEDFEPRKMRDTQQKSSLNSGRMSDDLSELYARMGKWMSAYRSGKVLKGLKLIPRLNNWEEAIYAMNPLSWSPAAHYQAVRILVSNLSPSAAQRYLNLVLLPAMRDNIAEYKKLNFHFYEALKKAVYKPAAFFKGIILPVILPDSSESPCTNREAVILFSVLSKVSIPMLHGAAALFRIASVTADKWTGPVSIFITALINKHYSLPGRVISCLIDHFCSFREIGESPVVLWHICLLSFVTSYSKQFSEIQRRRIFDLVTAIGHPQIGTEIRRALDDSRMDVD